jgi:hypothetical protein
MGRRAGASAGAVLPALHHCLSAPAFGFYTAIGQSAARAIGLAHLSQSQHLLLSSCSPCCPGDEVDLSDGKELRRLALSLDIPTVTTLAGCQATTSALRAMRSGPLIQTAIQVGLGLKRGPHHHDHTHF